MSRKAAVFFNGTRAGTLAETPGGYEFTYTEDYLAGGVPISFGYPLRKEPYVSEPFPPFFENLLSEGWLKNLQSREQKIDENDHFGLLVQNGHDLVGAVTVEEINA